MTVKDKIMLRDFLRTHKEEARSIIDGIIFSEWAEEADRTPGTHYHCKNCNAQWGRAAITMKYCPNCGSKMKNQEELYKDVMKVAEGMVRGKDKDAVKETAKVPVKASAETSENDAPSKEAQKEIVEEASKPTVRTGPKIVQSKFKGKIKQNCENA